jgi:uncharacterized protein (DUF433 family)
LTTWELSFDGWAATSSTIIFFLAFIGGKLMQSGTHIELDGDGTPWIRGANMQVVQIIQDVKHGESPEAIHARYPDLSLEQIHAALAYYDEHKQAIDADVERLNKEAEERKATIETKLAQKAAAEGDRANDIKLENPE